jgi:hypothetical protein
VKFLRDHESDLDEPTVHNIFETQNTFLRTRDILIAGKILAELDYAEKAKRVRFASTERSVGRKPNELWATHASPRDNPQNLPWLGASEPFCVLCHLCS